MSDQTPQESEAEHLHKLHGLDWFSWAQGCINKKSTGLIIGARSGEVSEWFLKNVFTHTEARLWSLDTFEGTTEEKLAGVDCSDFQQEIRKRLEGFGHRAQLFKSETHEALRKFFAGVTFDLIYVDGAKEAMDIIRESVLAFELLHIGGVMIWSGYEWDTLPDETDRPKLAIDAFLKCYCCRCEVIGVGSGFTAQIAVRRTL